MKDNNFNNQFFNSMNNTNFMKMSKWIYLISFIFQWSILSMIINLFTLGMFRFIVFFIFILDGFSMLIRKNKTIKAPSFVLSVIWKILDHINLQNIIYKTSYYTHNFITKLKNTYNIIADKLRNTKQVLKKQKSKANKYKKERMFNKFSDEIGKKVIVEYVNEDGCKLQKDFKYKDRLKSFINLLSREGYKDYTVFNIDPRLTPAYIIKTPNGDLVDVENDRIKISHNDSDYKFIMESWI